MTIDSEESACYSLGAKLRRSQAEMRHWRMAFVLEGLLAIVVVALAARMGCGG